MIEQLKTIREALVLGIKAINHLGGAREAMPLHDAMPALTQLEAMAESVEPVGEVRWVADVPDTIKEVKFYGDTKPPVGTKLYAAPPAQQYEAGDVASAAAQGFRDGVASVAQQPSKAKLEKLREWETSGELIDRAWSVLQSQEQEIMRLEKTLAEERAQQPQAEAMPVAVLRRGEDGAFSVSVGDYLLAVYALPPGNHRLFTRPQQAEAVQYTRADLDRAYSAGLVEGERLTIQQAEAVQACGHPMSLLLRSAESNEPLYCEACDDKSGRHDAERRETELLDANRHLQEKIASADALKLHAIEELCRLGYTVKDGELFPPDHLHKLMEAANHPLCGKQTEAVPPDVVRDAEGQ